MKYLIVFVTLFSVNLGFADSPLTSTSFYKAYVENEILVHVKERGLDETAINFLGNKRKDPVLKIAIINSLIWGSGTYLQEFERYLLINRKGLEPEVFDFLRSKTASNTQRGQSELLTADDLMCWAYLQAMSDYFNPSKAIYAATLAKEREPKSMAHAVVFTLISCQVSFDNSWCKVYELGHQNITGTEYSDNQLKDEAVAIIMDYLTLYKSYCN